MTTAVIGATGRVGNEVVRGLLAGGDSVVALVRDPAKAQRLFGEPNGLRIRSTQLDDPRDLAAALTGVRTAFIAMGSIGIEGVLQRIAINVAAATASIEHVTRLAVLNTSPRSLGINQRAHYSIDEFARSTALPYSTIRPAIFSSSLLAAGSEVRASRTWTGLAGRGRTALIDHRDAAEFAVRVTTDPALWGAHYDLTGPVAMSWPEALELLSAELGEPVTFRVVTERQLLDHLVAAVPAGTAQLLITREWAIEAGENNYTTETFQKIIGRPPRPVAEFLHDHRAAFASRDMTARNRTAGGVHMIAVPGSSQADVSRPTVVATSRTRGLPGQTVVIMGGSSGMGLATAKQARGEGANVIITGRDKRKLARAAAEVGAVASAAFDVSSTAELDSFFARLPDQVDHIMLVAGGPYYAPLADMDFDQAAHTLNGLLSRLRIAREAQTRIRPGGSLLLIGGTGARRPGVGLTVPAMVTAALPALTANLALELAPVRVNLIAPGFVDTPLSAALLGDQLDARRAHLRATLPIRRVVQPEDVAALAIHLMTNTALTGATYDVDGGQQVVPDN